MGTTSTICGAPYGSGAHEAGATARQPAGAEAISAAAAGRPVVVVTGHAGGACGYLVTAAAAATPEIVAFTVRHTSGFLCVSLPANECVRLGLPKMCANDGDRDADAQCVAVDLAVGGTGISAADRARTVRALANPWSEKSDFTRPGHVVPLCPRPGGLLGRLGIAEAAHDLIRLSGLAPVALYSIIVGDQSGDPVSELELEAFAARHALPLVRVDELLAAVRRDVGRKVLTSAAAS